LAGGKYIIVAAPEHPNTLGDFYLSIYVNSFLRDIEIKRVFHPNVPNDDNEEVLP